MIIRILALMVCGSLLIGGTACTTREVIGGAAVGGAAYEYSNKRAIDALNEDYRSGRITREEYERRKEEIESRSLLY